MYVHAHVVPLCFLHDQNILVNVEENERVRCRLINSLMNEKSTE